ncbi:MAG: hypothetical protein ACP5UI_01095 [Thermoprotei archaeon]
MTMGQSADRNGGMTGSLPRSPDLGPVQEKIRLAEELASKLEEKAEGDSLKLSKMAQTEASILESLEADLEKSIEKQMIEDATKNAETESNKIIESGRKKAQETKRAGLSRLDQAVDLTVHWVEDL